MSFLDAFHVLTIHVWIKIPGLKWAKPENTTRLLVPFFQSLSSFSAFQYVIFEIVVRLCLVEFKMANLEEENKIRALWHDRSFPGD